MPSFRDGQYNLSGLTNPGVYIGIVPPTPFVNGVPSNIEAAVGVGSWGPVNAVAAFNDPDGCTAFYGPPQVRYGDIATHVAAACQEGKAIAFRGVRVTDGTDVAATAAVPGSAGTFTARYTGTVGNRIGVVFQPSAAVGSYSCIVTFPGRTPERFDNILPAVQSLTVGAGTGYASVPAIALTGPQRAGGIQAAARASLVAVGTPVVASGGAGYVAGDKITLPNGVTVTVATVIGGAAATVTLTTPGLITSGAAPANPVSQASTTGTGTGATFTVGYGLGPATITAGSGYTSAPTLTLSGGGGGTGGSYTPIVSFYAGLAAAINNGTTQRGRSLSVVYTPGTSTAAPTLGTPIVLSGGTDGAGGVGTAQQVGVDALPRTGMYALRGTGADTFALCDSTDSSAWGAMLAFAISENMLAVATTASGDSIAGAVAARIAAGVDDTNFKLIAGDWPTFYDAVNGPRLVSPTAIYQGLVGNLSPEQSPINKPLVGVTATQGSQTGVLISDTDEATAQTGGIDIIGRASALGADYFSFLTGRNTSSNTAANGDEYTRLTANLVRALQGSATRSIVGRLQSVRADDPTRIKAKAAIDSYLQSLVDPQSGSDGYGMIDQFATVCDQSNNTPTTVARGFLFLYAKVRYLNAVRYFVIKLAGGGNVTVTSQATQPTIGTQLAA